MASQVDQWNEEGLVKIKPEAYITMIKHVLTYGNKLLGSKSEEVMGICIGKQINTDIVVYDAIPVSHGSSVEEGFTPSDYTIFAQVDELFAEDNSELYACGWYHSHPNKKAFFSQVDIKNQLYYQKEETPKGFGIVFDHQYFDEKGHSGFKIFRLNNYKMGTNSEFHECKFELLLPQNLNVFHEIQNIIESAQLRKPFITEVSSLNVDDSIWSPPKENQSQKVEREEEKEKNSNSDLVAEGHSDDKVSFSHEFTQKFFKKFDEFKDQTSNEIQRGDKIITDVLTKLKEIVEIGGQRINKNLEDIMREEICSVQNSVENLFKKFDEDLRQNTKESNKFSNKMILDIKDVFKAILEQNLNPFIEMIKEIKTNADIISDNTDGFKSGVNNLQEMIEQSDASTKKDNTPVKETIRVAKHKIKDDSKEMSKLIHESLQDLKKNIDDISKLLNNLQKKVSKE